MNTLLRVGDKVVNTATVTHIKLNDSGGAVSIEFVGGIFQPRTFARG
jgi:hypothetical protein